MTITWDNSGWAYEKGPCSRSNCEINPCSGHCKVRRPEHDRPAPVAWIATRLWNDRETWTGPADIAAMLAPAPVAQPLAKAITRECTDPRACTLHRSCMGRCHEPLTNANTAIRLRATDAAAPAPVAQGESVAVKHCEAVREAGRAADASVRYYNEMMGAAPAPVAQRDDGMPTSADERRLRHLLAACVAMPNTYMDDGEAQGHQHGIAIDFMREPVSDIDAKLRALNVAWIECAAPAPVAQPLTDEQILARGPAGITKHSYLRGWRDCEAASQEGGAA